MKNVKLLPLLLSASLSLTPLNGITASAEDSAYSFHISFIDEESEEYVANVDAKLIQRAIEWTDEEHYACVGDENIVCEWNSSDEKPFITPTITDNWQDYAYAVVVDKLPEGYIYNSGKSVDYGISGYLDGEVKVAIKLNEGAVQENTTPLEGTYSLRLNVMDIVRNEKVAGLDCELFNLQTGEVVAAWSTSETEEMYVENLRYDFDKPDSYNGNITYAIRITNLPENYRFFYGKTRNQYGVSGFGLEEFANGTDISCTVYLEDTSEDAPKYTYVTTPQGNTTTVTTTTTVTDDVVATTSSDTESQSSTTATVTEPVDLNTIPLSGTYTLKLNVMDIVRNEKVAGLDCELVNLQTGEVVATWNTSETEEMYVENLQYSFDKPDSYNGNITYAIRITNLPENYRFFYGKTRDQYGVSGFGLEEFANGTDISCTVYLEDTSEDAPQYTYVTLPQENTTTVTTTTITADVTDTSAATETEPQTTTSTTVTEPVDLSNVPLNGTYTLKLNVMDIVRNEKVAGLDCELINIQSGEVVATWNTSETEEMYVENLQYSFDKADSYNGNITYAIRITNLPENYRFFYGKTRDQYGVSGFSLAELANGTDISCTIYLEDTSEDAPQYTYVTTPQESTTTTTTTITGDSSEELPQTGYSGIYNVVVGLAAVLTVSGIALIAKSKKENE